TVILTAHGHEAVTLECRLRTEGRDSSRPSVALRGDRSLLRLALRAALDAELVARLVVELARHLEALGLLEISERLARTRTHHTIDRTGIVALAFERFLSGLDRLITLLGHALGLLRPHRSLGLHRVGLHRVGLHRVGALRRLLRAGVRRPRLCLLHA